MHGLAVLVMCPAGGSSRIAETLLSLAAQTNRAFDIDIVAADCSPPELRDLADLVGTFDEGFSDRVKVVVTDPIGSKSPFAFGVAQSRATYVTVLYPDDVVFAHWAETFVMNAPAAGGRAMSSLVAWQAVEQPTRGDVQIITTVGRPRFPDPTEFDLVEHLASSPTPMRGLAVPRIAAQGLLGQGIPVAAEEWAVRLAVALSFGVFYTGEVTCLCRSLPVEHSSLDPETWKRDRNMALEILGRCGLALGPGVLKVHSSSHARVRVEDSLSPAKRKGSPPLRALGGVARRLRRPAA